MTRTATTVPKGAVAKLKRNIVREFVGEAIDETKSAEPEQDVLVWQTFGRHRNLRLLSPSEVEGMHWELARDFADHEDAIDPPGVRSNDLLESAVYRQHTGIGEVAKYPTAEMAAAALLHSLVHDHPFHNGNKRTALVCMLVLLDENGIVVECKEDDLFQFVLRLAQHKLVPTGRDLSDREMQAVAKWICEHSRNLEKGDRPIPWRRLRQILNSYGCELVSAPSVGNRINLRRVVDERALFGRRRRKRLEIQVHYGDEGREVAVNTVKTLRQALWLDDDHGIDSRDFYHRGNVSPSPFIMKYRKTLKRLARL